MHVLLSIVSAVVYSAAWAMLLRSIAKPGKKRLPATLLLVAIGIALHGATIATAIVVPEGYRLGLFQLFSLFACLVCLIVFFSGLRKPLHNVFVLLLPISIIAVLLGDIGSDSVNLSTSLATGMLTHVLSSVLAYCVLTIASLQALLIAYQHQKLRRKHPAGVIGWLPPLETMERLLFELVWVGEVMLTIAIITGAIFIEDMFAQHLAHKTIFSLLSWLIFAVLLVGRHTVGWRGPAAIRWTLGGFAALMLAYFGTKVVLELILKV